MIENALITKNEKYNMLGFVGSVWRIGKFERGVMIICIHTRHLIYHPGWDKFVYRYYHVEL